MIVLVKHHYDILAAATITSGAEPNENYELTFEIPSDPAAAAGFEFLLQLVAPAKITLHTLTLERANLTFRETDPAICTLENWLPFLKTTPSAKADADGVVVAEGRADYAVYGPYWTLPAGRYELVATIVPPAPNPDGKPIITVDVTAEHGQHQLAGCHWRLGQFESGDPHAAVEFRLPFTLAADLSPELRTIETRVFTPGDSSFRIRSLAVRVRTDELERNWFRYLIAGECGIYSGGEIRSVENKTGCIAYTPPLDLDCGHYELFLDAIDVSTKNSDPDPEAPIVIEIWSGSEVLAMQTAKRGSNAGSLAPQAFEVTKAIAASGAGVELSVRTITPAAISIHGLRVEKTAGKVAPSPSLAALAAKEWLAFFGMGPAGLKVEQGVLAPAGKAGNVGYVQRPFSPGRYEVILKVQRVGQATPPAAWASRLARICSVYGTFYSRRGLLDRFASHVGHCAYAPSMHLPACHVRRAVFKSVSTAPVRGNSMICSVAVKPKTRMSDLRDQAFGAGAKLLRAAAKKLQLK